MSGKNVEKETSNLPQANTKSNEEILPNGVCNVGIAGATASLPKSTEKEDEKVKKLLDQSEEPNNRKRSTLGNKKVKANKAPAGQTSGAEVGRRLVT